MIFHKIWDENGWQEGVWYYAVPQGKLFNFPPTPEGFVMEKRYTVPGCHPDCFKLSKASEKGGSYVAID